MGQALVCEVICGFVYFFQTYGLAYGSVVQDSNVALYFSVTLPLLLPGGQSQLTKHSVLKETGQR